MPGRQKSVPPFLFLLALSAVLSAGCNFGELHSLHGFVRWGGIPASPNCVPGAAVTIGDLRVTTDGNGYFLISGIPGNSCRVDVTAADGFCLGSEIDLTSYDPNLPFEIYMNKVYYVAPAPEGDDANLGTQDKPLATIAAALAKEGWVCAQLKPGSYLLSAPLILDNHDMIMGDPTAPDTCVIDGGSLPTLLQYTGTAWVGISGVRFLYNYTGPLAGSVFQINGGGRADLNSCKFVCASKQGTGVAASNGAQVNIRNCTFDQGEFAVTVNGADVMVQGGTMQGYGIAGIAVGNSSSTGTLRVVAVAMTGDPLKDGIQFSGEELYARDCDIEENYRGVFLNTCPTGVSVDLGTGDDIGGNIFKRNGWDLYDSCSMHTNPIMAVANSWSIWPTEKSPLKGAHATAQGTSPFYIKTINNVIIFQ